MSKFKRMFGNRGSESQASSSNSQRPSNYENTADPSIPDTQSYGTSFRSSHNEAASNNRGVVENWAADAAIPDPPPKYSIRRKPVPGTHDRKLSSGSAETSSMEPLRRTETSSSDGRVSENSTVVYTDGNRVRSESSTSPKAVPRENASPSESIPTRNETPNAPATGAKRRSGRGVNTFSARQLKGMISSISRYRDGNENYALIVGAALLFLAIIWRLFSGSNRVGVTPSSPIIAIMGETGAGKSSFIKALGGRDELGQLPVVGHTLNSTTKKVSWYSAAAGNKGFHILDTPGFDDSYMSDFEILEGLTLELAQIYAAARPLTGIIYVHDVSKEKMGGTSHKSLRTFQKLVGDTSLQNVVLATTHWRTFFKGAQVQREEELRTTFWAPMITRGSKILRHDGSRKSALRIVREMLNRKPVTIKIVDEMVNGGKRFDQTEAGSAVKEGLAVLEGKLDTNVAALNGEISELKTNYKQLQDATEAEKKKLWKQWETSSQNQKKEIEKKIKDLQSESQSQRKEFNKQLAAMQDEKETLRDQIAQLERANTALKNKLDKQGGIKAAKTESKSQVGTGKLPMAESFVLTFIFTSGLLGIFEVLVQQGSIERSPVAFGIYIGLIALTCYLFSMSVIYVTGSVILAASLVNLALMGPGVNRPGNDRHMGFLATLGLVVALFFACTPIHAMTGKSTEKAFAIFFPVLVWCYADLNISAVYLILSVVVMFCSFVGLSSFGII
ncbi:hypothetical protein H072_7978 [Dactylellina haptotyla CBS 200.50]|uniref:G domain-containing protein n=1 Tax=Dactylellina haptotyla (strain CBS 200.50) TaxID=1284197 RepID=S8BFU9_DACHA|nr:hypothetical protein H072_7978 [Dactylellina haptotyla CBS 200.50]